jgi:hypothetical protein
MYDENENVIQQWFGGDSRKLIICLKRWWFIFIKRKRCDKHNPEFCTKICAMWCPGTTSSWSTWNRRLFSIIVKQLKRWVWKTVWLCL